MTPAAHHAVLAELESLVPADPAPGTVDGDRLAHLAQLVADHEGQRWPALAPPWHIHRWSRAARAWLSAGSCATEHAAEQRVRSLAYLGHLARASSGLASMRCYPQRPRRPVTFAQIRAELEPAQSSSAHA